nr:carbohydrate ABC transporter permease [Actinorugispora endophytica]
MREATPLTYIGLTITVLLSVFPLWWMFVVASRDSAAASARPPQFLPGGNFPANLERLFANTTANFTLGLTNSAISATVLAVSVVLFSSMAGFALAKLRFKGRNVAAVGVVVTMAVPVQMGIIPLLMLMGWFGWRGEIISIIVPFMVSGFGVFMMRQYCIQAIPDELLEAARMDGCSTFRVYWSVVLPALRPAMIVLGLLTFMTQWNEFTWALAVLTPSNPTVQLAINQLNQSAYSRDFALMFTGSVVATLPLLILFFVLGRQLIGRIMEGAIKS